MIRLFALVFLASAPLVAQIHAGLKAGVPLTDLTKVSSNGANTLGNLSSHWTFGPMIELDLPLGLGVEFDALYRRVGYERVGGLPSPPPQLGEFKDGLWDFPLLAKYKFPGHTLRPYVGVGWTYRHLNDLLNSLSSGSNGFVLAGGVRIDARLLKISPEFRYTHWSNKDVVDTFQTKNNQAEILVGFTF
jgi:hypothetical protein